MFFLNIHSSKLLISIILIISFFWGFCIIAIIWTKIIKPHFYDGSISLDKLVYIVTKEEQIQCVELFVIKYKKIIDGFSNNHKIKCKQSRKECKICQLLKQYESVDDNFSIPNRQSLIILMHIYIYK